MIDARLETLLKVNETMSFTRAAEQLSLTQPAVSQHIKLLEKDCGAKLFIRGEGGLKLTDEGRIVLKYARRMKALNASLQSELSDREHQVRRLTVGVTHTGESNFMAEVLARYCRTHEGTHITMVTDTAEGLYSKLRTYEVDLAVIDGRVTASDFQSLLLDTDSLVVAVSPANPLSQKETVTLEELRREKIILRPPTSGTRNLFASHLESNNVSIDELNIILEVDNVATIKDLVQKDFGVSVLARSACMSAEKKGKLRLLPVEKLSMIRQTNLVFSSDFVHRDMLDELAELYKDTHNKYQK